MNISRNNKFEYKIVVAFILLMLPSFMLQSCATVIEKGEGYCVYAYNRSSGRFKTTCSKCGVGASVGYCRDCGAVIGTDHKRRSGEEAEITTSNQELITKLAMENKRWSVRNAAAEKVTDQKVLAEIAKKDSDRWVRITAVKNITDQKVLAEIAKKYSDRWVRKTAVKSITDQKVLSEIAKKDSDEWVRRVAIERLRESLGSDQGN